MNDNVDGQEHERTNIVPQCFHCYKSDLMELIDVVVSTQNTNHGCTEPIWFCKRCEKLTSKRVSTLETALSSGGAYHTDLNSILADSPGVTNGKIDLDNATFYDGSEFAEHVKSLSQNKIDDFRREIEFKIEEIKNWKSDPLNNLEESINNFSLLDSPLPDDQNI